MLAFAIRRLIEAIFVLLTVAVLAFVLFRFVGDPVNQMVGQDTPLEDRIRLRKELGLDDPIVVQLGRFLKGAVQFDFGISYQVKQPVINLIAERFPATIELSLAAAIFAVVIGIPMGVYTGIHREFLAFEDFYDSFAHRHIVADVSHRHSADLFVLREARRCCRHSGEARWCRSGFGEQASLPFPGSRP